ncbi:MAG: YkgJ family cysteine cluster protein [Bacteriovorax sp.]
MNFPAIAKQTYESLKNQNSFSSISQFIIEHLKKISSPLEKARFVHNVVDDYNKEVFSHPLVKELSPCKTGCSACCHTQVSVTEDEAELLISRITDGIKIDYALLKTQMKAGDNSDEFYKLSFEDRKCIFLSSDKTCQVYNDRPSVCRTNAVIGEAAQCSTTDGIREKQTLRLIKTPQSDMAIMGSFLASKRSGSLALMLGRILFKDKAFPLFKKPVFKALDL